MFILSYFLARSTFWDDWYLEDFVRTDQLLTNVKLSPADSCQLSLTAAVLQAHEKNTPTNMIKPNPSGFAGDRILPLHAKTFFLFA